MKPLTRRPIALALLIALHGITTLCGPTMHRHDRSEGFLCGHKVTDGVPAAPVGLSHADCTICHFFTQGQLGTDRARINKAESVVGVVQLLQTRDVSPQLIRTSRPRAPPQV